MEKPVIILGGGIWGALLGHRLKEALPQVEFRLYEESSSLGNHQSCSFRETDCGSSITWLRPLISRSWNHHHIKFRSFERWITSPYHLIDSRHLHDVVSKRIALELRLNNKLKTEFALEEGSFVIDTRNICHYKKTGYRKHLTLEIDLMEEHHLIAPVIFDQTDDPLEPVRSLQYLPLTSKVLLVRDSWYSDNKKIDLDEMRNHLALSIQRRGWKIAKILREESGYSEMPTSAPVIRQEGRVVNLAGIFHDTTGCSISCATKLIDRMVATSFRFGEVREVVKEFRKEQESDRKFFRFLNRELIEKKHPHLFEAIYQQPSPLIERFSKGRMNVFDRSRITLGKSHRRISGLINMVLPYAFCPGVQVPRRERVSNF